MVYNNKYAISISHTQARLVNISRSILDVAYVILTCSTHGMQKGRISRVDGCHFSGHQLFTVADISWNGPLIFNACYAESLYWLGFFGQDLTTAAPIIFTACDFSFNHRDIRTVPATISYTGTNVGITFDNCRFTSPYLKFGARTSMTFRNCITTIFTDNMYPGVDADDIGFEDLGAATCALNVPTFLNKISQNCVGVSQDSGRVFKDSYDKPLPGDDNYRYEPHINTDRTIKKGYLKREYNMGAYMSNIVLDELRLTFQWQLDVGYPIITFLGKGDKLTHEPTGIDFMILSYDRDTGEGEALLLHGYQLAMNSDDVLQYFFDTSKLTSQKTYTGSLSGARYWKMQYLHICSYTGYTNTLTGIGIYPGFNNGLQSLRIGQPIYVRLYDKDISTPKDYYMLGPFKVLSVDSGTNTVVLNEQIRYDNTGNLFIFNQDPFE